MYFYRYFIITFSLKSSSQIKYLDDNARGTAKLFYWAINVVGASGINLKYFFY